MRTTIAVEMKNPREAWRPTRESKGLPVNPAHIVHVERAVRQRGRNRKGLSTLRKLCYSVIFMTAGLWWLFSPSDALTYSHTSTYEVQRGDTLWSIAERFNRAGYTPQVVSWIEDHNSLNGQAIVPGQRLVIPVSN